MTLTEYLNQQEPQHRPTVNLKEGEFKVVHTLPVVPGICWKSIIIPELHKRFNLASPYIQVNDNKQLFTQDQDGNPKSRSVFLLP